MIMEVCGLFEKKNNLIEVEWELGGNGNLFERIGENWRELERIGKDLKESKRMEMFYS